MPYISSSGTVQDGRQPFTVEWFREMASSFFTFIYLFFATLFGLSSTAKNNDKYQSEYRDRFRGDGPGGGGRGAPRHRNIGRLGGGINAPNCPPMAGGGG